MGEKENGRARGRHARGEGAPARKAPENRFNSGGVRTTIAKHHGRYSKSDHLCQDGVE